MKGPPPGAALHLADEESGSQRKVGAAGGRARGSRIGAEGEGASRGDPQTALLGAASGNVAFWKH